MKLNEYNHGFLCTAIQPLEEIKADIYTMEHVQSGARLIWIRREDENKTFAIAFKTTPVDDTGVFHILEHSVLNGSRRYPVKEPFVDLLKGSLQTFLNAITFADKTVYPISSRNDKDFINLMRVYLDAVFYPNVVTTNPNTFRQEGWHYELFEEDRDPIYKGVVFNEMKGAFSSPDSVRSRLLMHELFPDNCYGNESGGDPECIPELTYEQFCEAHKKYYYPSNSYIILDGDLDIDATLGVIDDEYLSNFQKAEEKIVIEDQKPHVAKEIVKEYEIAANEDPRNKAHLSFGYVYGKYSDFEKSAALSLISSVLCGTNESPLKKVILDNDLGEDIFFDVNDGINQPYVEICVINTDESKDEAVTEAIRNELKKIVKEGIDRRELEAALNKAEFRAKELDFGGAPKGLVFALTSLDSWLYGGDPADALKSQEVYASLREKLNTSYFEDLLQEAVLDSKHSAKVLLKASNTLGEEKMQKEKDRLTEIKKSWSKEEVQQVIAMNENLLAWQKSEDTPEQQATLPKLTLEDLKKTPTRLPLEVYKAEEETIVMKHDIDTNGISYVSLFFNIDDVKKEDLSKVGLLKALLASTATENYDTNQLAQKIKSTLGELSFSLNSPTSVKTNVTRAFFSVSFSSLHRNDEAALELIKEILYRSKLNDTNAIHNIVRQIKTGIEQAFIGNGNGYGVNRAMAYETEEGIINEYSSGYEYYKFIKSLDAVWDEKAEETLTALRKLYEQLFIKERVCIGVASLGPDAIVKGFLNGIPSGTIGPKAEKTPLGHRREGIIVPANISYACKGFNSLDLTKDHRGTFQVLSNILTYDYLWNNIRVKGGAYGCGFACKNSGYLRLHSYRDPNPANSLSVYKETPQYLSDFCDNNADVEKYIVGTTGEYDPYLSNKLKIKVSEIEYLTDIDYAYKSAILTQILHTTTEDIRSTIPVFEAMNEKDNVCVIGNKEALNACKDELDDIFEF